MFTMNREPHGLAWYSDRKMTKQVLFSSYNSLSLCGKILKHKPSKKQICQYWNKFLIVSCYLCGRSLLFWHILAGDITVYWPANLYVSLSLCFNVTPQYLSLPFNVDTSQQLSFTPEKKGLKPKRDLKPQKGKTKEGLNVTRLVRQRGHWRGHIAK